MAVAGPAARGGDAGQSAGEPDRGRKWLASWLSAETAPGAGILGAYAIAGLLLVCRSRRGDGRAGPTRV